VGTGHGERDQVDGQEERDRGLACHCWTPTVA
jgi:hypothetical protein